MKHLIIVTILVAVLYAGYYMAPVSTRAAALKLIAAHGIQVASILLIILTLLAIAYFTPSLQTL